MGASSRLSVRRETRSVRDSFRRTVLTMTIIAQDAEFAGNSQLPVSPKVCYLQDGEGFRHQTAARNGPADDSCNGAGVFLFAPVAKRQREQNG
jgi:hypothetical protein